MTTIIIDSYHKAIILHSYTHIFTHTNIPYVPNLLSKIEFPLNGKIARFAKFIFDLEIYCGQFQEVLKL